MSLSASWNNFSSINKFTGAIPLYNAMLESITDFTVPFHITIDCMNNSASVYAPFSAKIGTGKAPLTITLGNRLTKSEISDDNGNSIDYSSMIMLAAMARLEKGAETALPFAFPRAADIMAEQLGSKIHRFYSSSMDNSDMQARRIAADEKFLYDGFVLAVQVLRFMTEKGLTIPEALDLLPKFSGMKKFIYISCPPQKILGRISGGNPAENEGVVISGDGERIFLRSNKKGNGLYLFAESASSETAAELCIKTEKLIKDIMNDKGRL